MNSATFNNGATLWLGVQEGEETVSTWVGYQLNAIAGAVALGAHHTPGAIERPAVVLQDVARVDAPQGDCQCLKHPSGQDRKVDGELRSLLALVRDMHSRLPVLKSALAEAPVALHGQNRQRRRAVGVEANVLLAVRVYLSSSASSA